VVGLTRATVGSVLKVPEIGTVVDGSKVFKKMMAEKLYFYLDISTLSQKLLLDWSSIDIANVK
jgi:hypothetical protein